MTKSWQGKTIFLCVALCAMNIAHANPTTAPAEQRPLNFGTVSVLSELITPKKIVMFVSFRSDGAERIATTVDGRKISTPETGIVMGPDMSGENLRIKGKFQLIDALNLQPPELGAVDATMHVHLQWGDDNDPAMKRLYPLVPEIPGPYIAPQAIAVGDKGDEILDYSFVGPFPDEQKDAIESLAKYLVKHPFKDLSEDDAQAMLKDQNYVTVLTGLVWQDKHRVSTPGDYLSASIVMPRSEVRDVVDFMFRHLMTQNATKNYQPRQELSEALEEFLKRGDTAQVVDSIDAMQKMLAEKNSNALRAFVWEHAAISAVLASAVKAKEAQGSNEPLELNLIKSIQALMDIVPTKY